MKCTLTALALAALLSLPVSAAHACINAAASARASGYSALADAAIARGDAESLWFAALMRASGHRESACKNASGLFWEGADQLDLLERAASAAWSNAAVLKWISDILPRQPGADRGLSSRISVRLLELEPGNLAHWNLALRLAERAKAGPEYKREQVLRAAKAATSMDTGYSGLLRALNRQLALQPLPSVLGRGDPDALHPDARPEDVAFLNTASDEDIRLLLASSFVMAWPLHTETLRHCSEQHHGGALDPELLAACLRLAELSVAKADTVVSAMFGSALKARLSAEPADREAAIDLRLQVDWLQSVFAQHADLQGDLLALMRGILTENSTEMSVLRETAAQLGLETPSPDFVRAERPRVEARLR